MFALVCLLAGALPSSAQNVPEDQYFDSDGVKIRYVESGTGEPVVLGHGMSGSLEVWIQSGVFQNLAEDFRVIAFDQRGHGNSDKPHDVSAYGAKMGQDIIRLLDHLGIERAHVIGYSLGGIVLGKLITTDPDRLITVTLGGTALYLGWTIR